MADPRGIEVKRTYLEMKAPSDLRPARRADGDARVERIEGSPASFYRYLYAEVGRAYRWVDRLGWTDDRLMITYQSRFGKTEWTKPYTEEVIAELPRQGVKRILVMMPGFSADCLETLEEMRVRNAELFHANGGGDYAAVPCLNDSEDGMRVLETVVRRELQGWI